MLKKLFLHKFRQLIYEIHYYYYIQTINEEVNRFVNRILQEIGPILLGTALNPNLTAGRRTNSTNGVDDLSDEDNDSDDISTNNKGKANDERSENDGGNFYESGIDGSAAEDDLDDIPDTVFVPDAEFGRRKKAGE